MARHRIRFMSDWSIHRNLHIHICSYLRAVLVLEAKVPTAGQWTKTREKGDPIQFEGKWSPALARYLHADSALPTSMYFVHI